MVGRPRLPADRGCEVPGVPNRVLHQPGICWCRQTVAASYRSDIPADRRPLRVEHRRGASGDRRCADLPGTRRGAQRRARQPGARSAPHLRHVGRRGRPGDDQYASRRAFPPLDDDATGPRLMSTRISAYIGLKIGMSSNVTGKLIGGRRVRWDDERAADAYARGWWVRGTLADSLIEAAQRTPQRIVLIDGACQMDCRSLYEQSSALAQALLARIPPGSVVSMMLPNWHEAAIIYLAATMAGMVVNPILPSLRDRELLFILKDADTRIIFVPSHFGRHDYAAMLDRVVSRMDSPPEVVVVRGGAPLPVTNSSTVELPTPDPDAVRMILYTSGT